MDTIKRAEKIVKKINDVFASGYPSLFINVKPGQTVFILSTDVFKSESTKYFTRIDDLEQYVNEFEKNGRSEIIHRKFKL